MFEWRKSLGLKRIVVDILCLWQIPYSVYLTRVSVCFLSGVLYISGIQSLGTLHFKSPVQSLVIAKVSPVR